MGHNKPNKSLLGIASNAKYILVLNEINMEISALNQKLFIWSKNGGNLTAISFRSQKDNKPEMTI